MNKNHFDVFANTYNKKPLIITAGSGSYLHNAEGRKYLDFLSGISINNLGYSNKEIIQRISAQLERVIHPSNYYYTDVQIEFANKLVNLSGLGKVFFANSGTEANEAAISFTSKYCETTYGGHTSKNEVLVFSGSFFGRTFGAHIAATGGYYKNLKFVTVPFNNLDAFRKAMSPSTLGIYLEPILGHGGIRKVDPDIINEIIIVCKKNNLVLMVDEIQAGLGRAGAAFLFKQFGLSPDIVTLGKSIGGGLPLSAVLISDRIGRTIQPGDYGCTMGGNSLACAAGISILNFLSVEENLVEINKKGEYLLRKLRSTAHRYSSKIHDVRCYGLMAALEMRDGFAVQVMNDCLESGLLVDIVNQNNLRMLPPFSVSYAEIDIAMDIINRSIEKAS